MTYKPEKGSRQPVVLYDKDNEAIDVSGIKEISSIKIDTGEIAGDLKLVKDNQGRLYGKYGEAWIPVKVDSEGRPIIASDVKIDTEKIAGDLELVKDNQGRLYGKYGEAWIPVKVDSEGRPIIASDVTVNAEGMVVDLGQIKQGPAGTEPWPVQLSGAKVVESAPVTGSKTVTSTVAEVFAGSSRKANRSKLIIRNLHPAVAIRIGGSGITDTIGQSLEPGASVEIDFSPSTAVPIYAVSTAGNVSVEVLEV